MYVWCMLKLTYLTYNYHTFLLIYSLTNTRKTQNLKGVDVHTTGEGA